jgi:hypothetical protein
LRAAQSLQDLRLPWDGEFVRDGAFIELPVIDTEAWFPIPINHNAWESPGADGRLDDFSFKLSVELLIDDLSLGW